MSEGVHGLEVRGHVAIDRLQRRKRVLRQEALGGTSLLAVEERDHDDGEREQRQRDAGADRQCLTQSVAIVLSARFHCAFSPRVHAAAAVAWAVSGPRRAVSRGGV